MLKRVNKLFIQYQYDTRKIAPWKIALRKIVPYTNPNPNPNLRGTCWGAIFRERNFSFIGQVSKKFDWIITYVKNLNYNTIAYVNNVYYNLIN